MEAGQQSPANLGVSENPWKNFVMVPAYTKVTDFTNEIVKCVRRVTAKGLGVVTGNDVYALAKYY